MRHFRMALTMAVCVGAAGAALSDPLVEAERVAMAPVEIEDQTLVLADGSRITYRDTGGAGEVVMMAHPFTGNLHSFGYQEGPLTGAGYRVISWSRPGYAGSPWPGEAGEVPYHAEHVLMVMDALGIDRAHVVGVAAGGSTALDLVLTRPERVLTAVVASSLMGIEEEDYKAAIASARGSWFEALPEAVKELSPSFRVTWPAGLAAWEKILNENPPRPAQMPPLMVPQTPPTWERLAANRVPLLLITGGADLYQPPELLRRVAERIGAAEFESVPDAGHAIFFEQPEVFNRLLLAHFDSP